VTCLPVRIDDDQWQAAVFYVLPPDSACLVNGKLLGGPFAVELEADLHEHANGTVVELGLEINTPGEALRGVVLFLTGHSSAHFDALKMLSEQADIPLFLGDAHCQLLWQQRVPLQTAHRDGFKQLLDEAVGRDAFIRLSGHYDPDKAFAEVLAQRGMLVPASTTVKP